MTGKSLSLIPLTFQILFVQASQPFASFITSNLAIIYGLESNFVHPHVTSTIVSSYIPIPIIISSTQLFFLCLSVSPGVHPSFTLFNTSSLLTPSTYLIPPHHSSSYLHFKNSNHDLIFFPQSPLFTAI